MVKTRKLNPKCILNIKSLALTNDGIVLPCCECDTRQVWHDTYLTPTFKQLTQLSNINDFDSIDEIVTQPIWKKFQDELLDDIGPHWCYQVCGIDKDDRREHSYAMYENEEQVKLKFDKE